MKFQNNFNRIVEPATSVVNEKVIIPLVYTLENNMYHGFVPGFQFQDVVSKTLEECQKNLLLYVKEEVYKRIQEKLPFPFFPNIEQIKEDFDDVVKCELKEFDVPNL